jgi:hypothetical protein
MVAFCCTGSPSCRGASASLLCLGVELVSHRLPSAVQDLCLGVELVSHRLPSAVEDLHHVEVPLLRFYLLLHRGCPLLK